MDRDITPYTGSRLPLSERSLDACGRRIEVPRYDRAALQPGIVHFGVGGFHRAHQAVYLDELAQRGLTSGWGTIGVSMRHRRMKDALTPQDLLYTVIERDGDDERARAIGVMRDLIFAPDEPAAVLSALSDPRTRIVSLTITGGAYEDSGSRPEDGPDVFAQIAKGLDRRRRAGIPAFTIMSCDNVPANGAVARAATLSAASHDPELARWIESSVSFPSSVVDRITPKTTDDTRDFAGRRFGIEDRWPVIAEPYRQWIVEDDFCNGRPPLEDVGVQFVADTAPYELMKKRLLNGGHCALGYLGILAGHRRTDEAMADPSIRAYLRALMDEEVSPGLDEVAGIDIEQYKRVLIERFGNPGVGDQLARLCERGSVKGPSYLLPSVEDALADGRAVDLLAMAVAGWLRFLRGTDLAGDRIDVVDPLAARLVGLARKGGDDPRPVLGERRIFGDLIESEQFVIAVERGLRSLSRHGVAATLDRTVSRSLQPAPASLTFAA